MEKLLAGVFPLFFFILVFKNLEAAKIDCSSPRQKIQKRASNLDALEKSEGLGVWQRFKAMALKSIYTHLFNPLYNRESFTKRFWPLEKGYIKNDN